MITRVLLLLCMVALPLGQAASAVHAPSPDAVEVPLPVEPVVEAETEIEAMAEAGAALHAGLAAPSASGEAGGARGEVLSGPPTPPPER